MGSFEKLGSPTDIALASAGLIQGIWKYYKPELFTGSLVASALVYDLKCGPGCTISEVTDKVIDKHPVSTRLAIGVTALHLMNMLPNDVDPIHQVFKRIKGEPNR